MSVQKISAAFRKAGFEMATENSLGWNRGYLLRAVNAPDHHATVQFMPGGTRAWGGEVAEAEMGEYLAKYEATITAAGLVARRQGNALLVSYS